MLGIPALGAVPAALGAETAKKWKDKAELSFTNATGNSRLRNFGADNLFEYDWGRGTLELRAGLLAARDGGRTTAEQYRAGEKLKAEFDSTLYAYEKAGWDKDRFAGIRSRYDLSAGIGKDFWTTDKDKLSSEAGAGYINEERPDKVNAFGSGRLSGKYVRTLSPTSSFTQELEYIHNLSRAADYRLNAETALVAAINSHISLKASYKWKRVGAPAPGFARDDTLTGVSLLVNF